MVGNAATAASPGSSSFGAAVVRSGGVAPIPSGVCVGRSTARSRAWLPTASRVASAQLTSSPSAPSPRSAVSAATTSESVWVCGELRQAGGPRARASWHGRARAHGHHEGVGQVPAGQRLAPPVVGDPRGGLAGERDRVTDAGQRRRRPGAAGRSSAGRRWRARADGRRGCRCRPTRRSAGSSRCRSRVSYQL